MTYLARSFGWIFALISCVAFGVVAMSETLIQIASHNYILNGSIFLCIFCGVFFIILQMHQIYKEQTWLNFYEQGKENFPGVPKPKILAPLALASKDNSSDNKRTILASIENRLEDIREINRYFIGLLIFLGLLGTFWGLSKTIFAITNVIGGIDISSTDVKESMNSLKQGLAMPLKGMGTAFSCSLFGLSGSLILGFLDLQIGRAISSFFKNLENKLGSVIKISDKTYTVSGPAFSQGLLEQTIELMSSLQSQVKRGEENRIGIVKATQTLSEGLIKLNEQTSVHQAVMKKIAQNQIDLQEHFKTISTPEIASKEYVKESLKKQEIILEKILEELIDGRGRMTQDLSSEIRMIAKTLSALASND